MQTIQTEVLRSGPARFSMVGERLPSYLFDTDEAISDGLAKRIYHYAVGRLADAGFTKAVEGWIATVCTLDGDEKPADRSYYVRWKNSNGGYIDLVGILTRSGWPSLDHGWDIGHE
ncbi:hypothetical protein ACYPKM_02155 [Pseudomonas aeruginosa]